MKHAETSLNNICVQSEREREREGDEEGIRETVITIIVQQWQ